MMNKLAGEEIVRVVVLVRWEQFAEQFSVYVRGRSHVIGKTCRNFYTGKSAFILVFNEIPCNTGDVEEGKLVHHEVDIIQVIKGFLAESLVKKHKVKNVHECF